MNDFDSVDPSTLPPLLKTLHDVIERHRRRPEPVERDIIDEVSEIDEHAGRVLRECRRISQEQAADIFETSDRKRREREKPVVIPKPRRRADIDD